MVTIAERSCADYEPVRTSPFDSIYARHFTFVWRVLRTLGVPEHAVEDSAQEVFVIVHRKLVELNDAEGVRPWLFSIAVNVARNARRATRRRGPQVPLEEATACAGTDPIERLEARRTLELVLSVMETLPDDLRIMFGLTDVEQLAAPEIAAMLRLNLNTVYARQRRARERFSQALAARMAEKR